MAVTDPIRAQHVERIANLKRDLELLERRIFRPGGTTVEDAINKMKAEIEGLERFVRELDVSAGQKPTP